MSVNGGSDWRCVVDVIKIKVRKMSLREEEEEEKELGWEGGIFMLRGEPVLRQHSRGTGSLTANASRTQIRILRSEVSSSCSYPHCRGRTTWQEQLRVLGAEMVQG